MGRVGESMAGLNLVSHRDSAEILTTGTFIHGFGHSRIDR